MKHNRSTSTENNRPNDLNIEIPNVLQGEIARLDRKFRVTYDQSVQTGSKILKLICYLNDPYLTCVPPMYVEIKDDYPSSPPFCKLLEHEMNATPFLESVQKIFSARMLKMPSFYSLSHILDTWEMSIRQACSPNCDSTATAPAITTTTTSTTSVALGI